MWIRSFHAIIALLLSCHDNSSVNPTSINDQLIGAWDMRIGRNDSFLWHYEQGFQLMKNNKYHPRYWDRNDSTYYTDSSITGKWELDNSTRIVFHYDTSSVTFDVKWVEDKKIILSGKAVANDMREIVLFKIH